MKNYLFAISLILIISAFMGKDEKSEILKEVQKINNIDSLKLVVLDSSSNLKEFPSVFYKIEGNSSIPLKIQYAYFGRVNTCRGGGCDKPNNSLLSASEFFDYFILFDSTGTIAFVKITDYQATHGQEITAKSWLKQFNNYSAQKVICVGKEIDAISGATISTHAITEDIVLRSNIIRKRIKN